MPTWHFKCSVIVDDAISLIVGELGCSSMTEACGVLSHTQYPAFLVNAINVKNDFLKNAMVL